MYIYTHVHVYIYIYIYIYIYSTQSIRTRAELSDDGKNYILNGGKIWYAYI